MSSNPPELSVPYPLRNLDELNRRTAQHSVSVLERVRALEAGVALPTTIPVWAAAGDVPGSPAGGEIGVVTFVATSGAGLYFHDGTAWQKVTSAPGTLP